MRNIPRAMLRVGAYAAMLWSLPGLAADEPGAKPGDNAMTCAQIAAELAPYASQMAAVMNPLVETQSQLVAHTQQRQTEALSEVAALSAAATASHLDPTGLASRAVGQAEMTMQQAQWDRALAEDKPLMDQANRQMNDVASQANIMQGNARLQRLMQLVQQKNCQ